MRVSLVIPAYNEEGRLPPFLGLLERFHSAHPEHILEVLVADDGSTDRTSAVAESFANRLPLHVLRLPRNRGKGAAVRAGVLAAAGDAVIFMDADGATGPDELPKLLRALERAPIAVGNRWMAGSVVTDRQPFRAFSGWVYRTYVSLFGLRGIDTMCGFKGFQRAVANDLFAELHDERWLFDTEIMLRARRRGLRVENVPIAWTSKHGSKLGPWALARAFFTLPILAVRVLSEKKV